MGPVHRQRWQEGDDEEIARIKAELATLVKDFSAADGLIVVQVQIANQDGIRVDSRTTGVGDSCP